MTSTCDSDRYHNYLHHHLDCISPFWRLHLAQPSLHPSTKTYIFSLMVTLRCLALGSLPAFGSTSTFSFSLTYIFGWPVPVGLYLAAPWRNFILLSLICYCWWISTPRYRFCLEIQHKEVHNNYAELFYVSKFILLESIQTFTTYRQKKSTTEEIIHSNWIKIASFFCI